MCLPTPSAPLTRRNGCWSKSKLHQQQLPLKTRRLICQHPLECTFDSRGNNNTCQMGDCEFMMGPLNAQARENHRQPLQNILGEQDYYDVSLVGCFNLPMVVMPLGGKGECKAAGCDGDLRDRCPATTFKQVLPVAYSYTYDNPMSLRLCAFCASRYVINCEQSGAGAR